MKILVTGGLGFVGINLVRYLAQALKAQVIAADVLTPDPLTQVFLNPVAKRVRVVHLDVTDRAAFRQLVQTEAVTHIVHAAAITPDDRRERQQASFIVDVNLGGAINALDVALETASVERILLCSSGGVYGAPVGDPARPQSEDGPLQLDNLYAITKHSAELLTTRYAELSGKAMASARLAAVYGPMERPTGSREQMSHVQRLRAALETGRPVRVAGPEVLRDWTYTLDIGEAIRALLCAPRWRHTIYNVSCGAKRAVTFRQVVDAFVAHGLRVEWVQAPEAADVAMRPSQGRAPSDISRLQGDTGFAPRYDLATGLADYVSFHEM